MNFKKWLEDYKAVDADSEWERVQNVNMTAGLGWPGAERGKPIAAGLGDLTRGFHINTIVGRMMHPWVVGLKFAPINYRILESDPEKAFQYRTSQTDKRANNKYKAAYHLFKQEIANAVAALPFKTAHNLVTGDIEDAAFAAKRFLQGYAAEEKDMVESLMNAWRIYVGVFDPDLRSSYNQIQNFVNFCEIVKEEFMKVGEHLPSMGDDEGDPSGAPYVKELDRAIIYFNSLRGIEGL